MSDLPPDPARLRAILAHLDRQLADTDTLRTYLRLQRDEVQRALHAAGRPLRQPQQPQARRSLSPVRPAEPPPNGPTGAGDGYMLESKRHPKDPQPAVLHVDSCTKANRKASPISAAQFHVAIRDTEYIKTCDFCRPEDKPDDTAPPLVRRRETAQRRVEGIRGDLDAARADAHPERTANLPR
ncbi:MULTISPECIES: DUF6233 domain-containing protein [unclassified Streptomyces]|uniref:DUF6233 domain-containing protein n=1 Tax=unclassified Streptomyces TaxID=2593676 RepID=UPI002F90E034|nr:DUF6233 domain-containing protein [Streptomyces sp. NBC_01176]